MSNTPITLFDTAHFLPSALDKDSDRVLIAKGSRLVEITGDPVFSKLDLSGCDFDELPTGTTVTHCLDISDTRIAAIPATAVPAIMLEADRCRILEMPSVLDCERVSLRASAVAFPEDFSVTGDIDMRGATVTSQSRSMKALSIDMSGASVSVLPDTVTTGGLTVADTAVTRIGRGVDASFLKVSAGPLGIDDGVSVPKGITVVATCDGRTHSKTVSIETARREIAVSGGLYPDMDEKAGFIVVFDEFWQDTYSSLLARRRERREGRRPSIFTGLFQHGGAMPPPRESDLMPR